MLYREYQHIQKLKEWLKKIAYASLGLDFAIAVATLASFNLYSASYSGQILLYLNYALTAEVVLSAILFGALVFFMHYQTVLDHAGVFHKSVRHSVRHSIRAVKRARYRVKNEFMHML